LIMLRIDRFLDSYGVWRDCMFVFYGYRWETRES
jgi:hypothetical protein